MRMTVYADRIYDIDSRVEYDIRDNIVIRYWQYI